MIIQLVTKKTSKKAKAENRKLKRPNNKEIREGNAKEYK